MTSAARPTAFDEAIGMHRRGELPEAERAYRRLVQEGAAPADVEHMLGLVLHQQGRSEEALPWLERASARGDSPALSINFASVLLALGRPDEAETLASRALASQPAHVGAMLNVGLAREAGRRYPQAIEILERAVAAAPDNRAATRALARCLLRTDRPERALELLAALPPGSDAGVDLLRCEAWIATGSPALARPVLARLAEHPGSEAQAGWLLALAALDEKRSDDAMRLLRSVAERHPDHRMATLKLASLELARGENESSLAIVDRWLEGHPDDRDARTAHLIGCQYSLRYDAAALLAEHVRLAPAPAVRAEPRGTPARPRSSGRKRIGWVSPRFCHGPVETFFADALDALVRDGGFEHVLYMTASAPPSTTVRFRDSGATWRDMAWVDDAALLARVQDDGIDILVDLAGAGPEHRLAVFAARAAPLQLTWLDYFCTTGVAAIDALVTDAYLAPASRESHYVESLIRLPGGRLCYSPPPVPAPTSEGTETRRFVSFNRFSKINDRVVLAWAEAMGRLPDWTLALKGAGGDDAGIADSLRRRFAAHGVEASRIEISGSGPYAEAIDAYRGAAVALDPFPFSGCATTFDALWMGLPVVTRPLDTMASRQTGAILSAIGRDDWIAGDDRDYVDRIVDVARDATGRRAWRAEARSRLRPLTDADAFSRRFASAIEEAWTRRSAA